MIGWRHPTFGAVQETQEGPLASFLLVQCLPAPRNGDTQDPYAA
jgi:hypothetical protein